MIFLGENVMEHGRPIKGLYIVWSDLRSQNSDGEMVMTNERGE